MLGEKTRSGSGAANDLQRVLQDLAGGVEPTRLLASVLAGAIADGHGQDGVVLGLAEGATMRLAAKGAVTVALRACAEESAHTGRTSAARTRRAEGRS